MNKHLPRILVDFKDIKPGTLVYLNENDDIAIFMRSDEPPEKTLWINDKLWIIDWKNAPSWAKSAAYCDYDDPSTEHYKGKQYWMGGTGNNMIGYFVGYQIKPELYESK